MAKLKGTLPDKEHEPKPNANLSFPGGGGYRPVGFGELSLGDEITVIATGKVTRLSDIKDEWMDELSLGLDITSCSFDRKGKMSIDDALKQTGRGKRK